jgi:transglutaminase/protease-like cytokinesis protein 3
MTDEVTNQDQTVLNFNGRTYIPARKVAEAVGADPESMWDAATQTVNIDIAKGSTPTDYIQSNIFPNGIPVKQALKTDNRIPALAEDIVKRYKAKSNEQKANALYRWVISVMDYEMTDTDGDGFPDANSVGALAALNTHKGICYDYACLYAMLCDAAGLNVRLVGGFVISNGDFAGQHAWNEVQMDDGHWINVDPTWGDGSVKDIGENFDFYTNLVIPTPYGESLEDGRYSEQLFAEFENY